MVSRREALLQPQLELESRYRGEGGAGEAN